MDQEQNKKVALIVDDEKEWRDMVARQLHACGFSIIEATNGAEGLRKALIDHPDILILDVVMPEMDGLEMLEKLREDTWGRRAPVILLTHYDTDTEKIKKIIHTHPAHYIMKKDWDRETILEKINVLLADAERAKHA